MRVGYIRTCEKCGETKPLFFFRREPRIESGYQVKCRDCEKVDRDKWASRTKGGIE